jgi:hypothetical protein
MFLQLQVLLAITLYLQLGVWVLHRMEIIMDSLIYRIQDHSRLIYRRGPYLARLR